MKLNTLFESTDMEPTQKMVQFFEKRTKEHIDRVVANMKLVADHSDYNSDKIMARAKKHDKSKYGNVERPAYIWLTEYHRCNNDGIDFEYPEGMQAKVKDACLHHINVNKHHPEAHGNPNAMSEIDIIEMVADWTAMSQELEQDGGSAKGWADKNVGRKWKFNDEKKRLIYHIIGIIDAANS